MHFRTVEKKDVSALLQLFGRASAGGGLARADSEITLAFVDSLVSRCMNSGLAIVAEHPEKPHEVIGFICAAKPDLQIYQHVFTDLTVAVHPDFQNKGLGRSLLTLFMDEIVRNHPDIGKLETVVPESHVNAIKLFQSRDFLIEGRQEMRRRTADKAFEADIILGWQNPTFEFD